MKKNIIAILAVLLFFFSGTHAQLLRGYGFKIGAVAANQSWKYSSTPTWATDARWGITGSGYVEFLDLPFISLLAEIQYTQKGMIDRVPVTTEAQPDGTGEYITKSPRVDYISIPIAVKLRFSSPVVTPYILAGPRLDLLLSKKGDGYDAVIDQFKSRDLGATLGAGVELLDVLPVSLLAEFRFNPNFEASFTNSALTVKNRSFDFMLGVRF